MSSRIKIESFPQFKECCDSLGVTSIVDASNVGSHFVFAVNGFYPISFDIDTNYVSVFQGKARTTPDPLCIDISDDCKFAVTGHEDGSICLWSIEHNYSLIKSHQKMHTNPITQIRFGTNSSYVFVADTTGLTTLVSITSMLSMYAFKESVIYQGKLPVQSLIISRSNGPFPIGFIVFPTSFVCFDSNDILTSAFTSSKKTPFIESETFFDPPSLALYPRSTDYFLTICSGKSFKLLQVRSFDKMVPLISDLQNESGTICFSQFISNSLIVMTTTQGTMELITTNGLQVCSSASDELSQKLNAIRSVLCHNEKVILVTVESIFSLSFESWDEMIMKFAIDGNWTRAFQSLSEINLDLNRNLVGIPANLSIRRRKVIELGEKILDLFFKDAFTGGNCVEKVAEIAMYTTTLEITDYLSTTIIGLYEENGKLAEFFEGIQKGTMRSLSLFITPQFLRKLLEFHKKEGKIELVEEKLIELEYQETQVAFVLEVASEFGLRNLVKYLYTKYLNDPISPCQYFYESGYLLEYFEEIFNTKDKKTDKQNKSKQFKNKLFNNNNANIKTNNNENNEDNENNKTISLMLTQRSLIVWLMIQDSNGEFSRLRALFSKDWEKASLFTGKIISLLPIQFTFEDFIKIETFIEATLTMVECVEYSLCAPILDQILPIVPAKEISLSGSSLKHIMEWCFTSKFPSSVREDVFEIVSKQFPDILPKRSVAQWCESAGFSRFVLSYYLPQKMYGKIISSKLMNEESRIQVFDFIEEHVASDRDPVKVGILQNVAALLLSDPDRLTTIINTYYPDLHSDIVGQLKKEHKLVYLNSLVDTVGTQGLTAEWATEIFRLSLDFDADHAYHFLTEHINDVDLDEVERLAEKYNRVDCLVQIKIYNQQFREAIEQIGQEIERKLLEFIESGADTIDDIGPKSIDALSDMKELKEPMDTIRVAIKLLKTRSIDRDNTLQWQKMYLYFQFPMFHAAKAKSSIKNAVTLMFSFFIVTSLDVITAHHALLILCLHFSVLDKAQYNAVYANIFGRIGYQKNLFDSLCEMLITDCVDLIDQVYRKRSKGIKSQMTQCCTCQEPLSKSTDVFQIFPCGHCYHLRCNTGTKCPLCTGSAAMDTLKTSPETNQKFTTRQIQHIVRRMDFALRKNFGDEVENSQSANGVFFKNIEEESEKQIFTLSDMIPPPSEIVIRLDDDGEEDD